MEGWIKLHRQIFDNEYYFSEPFTRAQAWVDMLLLANHKDGCFFKRGIKVNVKAGEIGYDIDSLAKRWQWSRGKVERFFSMLENSKQIVRQKTNVTTLVSIVKYKIYQSDDKAKSNPNDKADGQQTVKQTDTNKNDNKVKNEENGNNILESNYLDVFMQECLSEESQGWREKVCMAVGQMELIEIPTRLEKFNAHCVAGGKTISTLKSYKEYFRNWMFTQKSIEQKNGTHKRNTEKVPERYNAGKQDYSRKTF